MTNTYRNELLGRIFALYADLGWATPTSIEYARITSLEATLDVATNAAERFARRDAMTLQENLFGRDDVAVTR
jgi:hypothetical protein